MRVILGQAGGAVVRDDHVPFSKEEVLEQSVFPVRGDPCFADAKHIEEEALDGQAPGCDQGGWRPTGAVCLNGAKASGVSAFRGHVVSDA